MDKIGENKIFVPSKTLHASHCKMCTKVYIESFKEKIFSILFIFVHRKSHKMVVIHG